MKNAKTLNVGGKEYILKLTSRAQINLKDKYKKEVHELMQDVVDVRVLADIIAASSLKYCKMNQEQALDLIDDLVDVGFLTSVQDRVVLCADLMVTAGIIDTITYDKIVAEIHEEQKAEILKNE